MASDEESMVERYRANARRMAPLVVALSLSMTPRPIDLAHLLRNMDLANRALALPAEIASGLATLRARGWLVEEAGRYGLREDLRAEVSRAWEVDGRAAAWQRVQERLAARS